MNLSENDIKQIEAHGLSVDEVQTQYMNFITGFPYVQLSEAATIGNGILRLNDKEKEDAIRYYKQNKENYSLLKFVPSSGAATRMFKDLFEFSGLYMGLEYTLKDFPEAKKTIENLSRFAFYEELKQKFINNSASLEEYLDRGDYTTIINYILTDIGLNYGKLPKALILFHKYEENKERKYRYAIEEHFVEAANYCKMENNNINIHFTISIEHKEEFERVIKEVQPYYEEVFGVKYNISFSFQKQSTDTIALNMDNTLAYDKDGKIIFRPSGHGALIENLNDIQGDIIFIKNIDNVAHDRIKSSTYQYKELIAGILLQTQEKIFSALSVLEKGSLSSQEVVDIIELTNSLGIGLSSEEKSEEKNNDILNLLFNKLNRPIRVCAMVKNEGEPGGGPFWIERNGVRSLQIVEKAEVDLLDENQKEIFSKATHFNPVDLVCGVKDFRGNNFNLNNYVDKTAGFISTKSNNGELIKAQEKPGLWNGAMADWITIFVEVPLETFTPVKTINDLLRAEHQEK